LVEVNIFKLFLTSTLKLYETIDYMEATLKLILYN